MDQEVLGISAENNAARRKFFEALYREIEGFACIAIAATGKSFRQRFFRWPEDVEDVLSYINQEQYGNNVYCCAHLLTEQDRHKPNATYCAAVWADLDACPPTAITPPPSLTLETSPNRYQGYWLLKDPVPPEEVEDFSHRISHNYKFFGVDPGWHLNKLLRVPLTYNVKPEYIEAGPPPIVRIRPDLSPGTLYTPDDLKQWPAVPGLEFFNDKAPQGTTESAEELLKRYNDRLDPRVWTAFRTPPPEHTWSDVLWSLENTLAEAGMSEAEVFTVAREAACNKYDRDNRSELGLWREVNKAVAHIKERQVGFEEAAPIRLRSILYDHERAQVPDDTFVDRFVKWGRSRSDVAPQYLEAGAFTTLSAVLSEYVVLPTSFGMLKLNMWFMLLGLSTVDRKTTAMRMAMHLLREVDPDYMLATDGSIEGLLTAIATRPGKPGIFLRDEFSGLLAAMTKKDYLAGMTEFFAGIYDGEDQRRPLARKIVAVKDPILLMLCGGVTSRIVEYLNVEHILSGFAPRFIFVNSDQTPEYRPVGPMTEAQDEQHGKFIEELLAMRSRYELEVNVPILNGKRTKRWDAKLSPDVWKRYNDFEYTMVWEIANKSTAPEVYNPMFDRLSKNVLKAAVLLAASRQDPREQGHVDVTMPDMLKAISYGERWREWSVFVAENAGIGWQERVLQRVLLAVRNNPGVGRSVIMRNHKLNNKDMDWIEETLRQRFSIRVETEKGGKRYYEQALVRP